MRRIFSFVGIVLCFLVWHAEASACGVASSDGVHMDLLSQQAAIRFHNFNEIHCTETYIPSVVCLDVRRVSGRQDYIYRHGNNSCIRFYPHNGGGLDSAMFIWIELCSSGFPPHPGPCICKLLLCICKYEDNSLRITSDGAGTASCTAGISLYDVYAKLKDQGYEQAKKNLRRLTNPPDYFEEWLSRKNKFVTSGGSREYGYESPALLSMEELNCFVRLLQERITGGPPVVRFIANVKSFFKAHKDVLQKIWPNETIDMPKLDPPTSSATPTLWTNAKAAISPVALQNAPTVFGVTIEPSKDAGVYLTKIRIEEVSNFVEFVGIYTCTQFVAHSWTSTKTDTHNLRFQCYRGIPDKRSNLIEASLTKQSRDSKSNKCSCPAMIFGKHKTPCNSTDEVELTIDLRHYGHRPGTTQDARLLPLLKDVRQKLNTVTTLFRNTTLVREYMEKWVREEFLPTKYPQYNTRSLHMLDGRFNPSDTEIRNSIAECGKKTQFSVLDQESTFLTIASQTNLCWVLRPAQGDTTTYMRTSPLSELMCAGRVSGCTCQVSSAPLVIPSDSETPPTTEPAKQLLKLCYHEHAASTRTTSKKRKGITLVAPFMYSN